MTTLIRVQDLALTKGTKPLFESLNFALARGDKTCLVGHNGCGKSSLLDLLSNATQADSGEVITQRGLAIGVVEQFVPPQLLPMSALDATLSTLAEHERDTRRFEAELALDTLGFMQSDFASPLERLSGGQQNLVLFARAIVHQPDVLLMDEPGNHMDVLALAQLQNYLQHHAGTFLMISHDRALLDACCNRTLFLRDRRIYAFDLGYSKARQALRQQDAEAERRRLAEGKEINRIRASAKRLAQWGKVYDNEDLARKAKTMEKRAEKLEAEQTQVTQGSGLRLDVQGATMRSKTVVTLEGFSVRTPDNSQHLFDCELLVLQPGDRVGLLGINGAGKSTCIERFIARSTRQTAHRSKIAKCVLIRTLRLAI